MIQTHSPALTTRCDNRLISLDAFRGLAMLLLIPNVDGGFSFHEMAERFPDSAAWSWLAHQFTHATWSGATLWDLVMPAFVFALGVSMPYSYAVRKQRQVPDASIQIHALLRAIALVMLGIFLLVPAKTTLDYVWPFLLLTLGLPVPKLAARLLGAGSQDKRGLFDALWWGVILSASAVRLFAESERLVNITFGNILAQLGLAYFFAFMLVGRSRFTQFLVAAGILIVWWLAFLIYPLPAAGFNPASVGALPGDELFDGYFRHWNKNTNLAAAFDAWFLNLFHRTEPFVYNSHGYQTLNFIPTIASMVFGVMIGEYLRSNRPDVQLRNRLFALGSLTALAGVLAGSFLCPVVKSIWTSSWALFSSGCVLLPFALLYHIGDIRAQYGWTFPLAVAGQNSLILYVLALNYRWWVLAPWRHTLEPSLSSLTWAPLLESAACGLTLWLVAFGLYRLKVFIRL